MIVFIAAHQPVTNSGVARNRHCAIRTLPRPRLRHTIPSCPNLKKNSNPVRWYKTPVRSMRSRSAKARMSLRKTATCHRNRKLLGSLSLLDAASALRARFTTRATRGFCQRTAEVALDDIDFAGSADQYYPEKVLLRLQLERSALLQCTHVFFGPSVRS